MTKADETRDKVDEAIVAHMKQIGGGDTIVTGWVVVAALTSPSHDNTGTDGYMSFTSDAMQHHGHIGLLTIALEERRNIGFISQLQDAITYLDEEDGEEDSGGLF